MPGETFTKNDGELQISFGYQCDGRKGTSEVLDGYEIPSGIKIRRNSSSFSCLSGAALSANATLANTNICNGLIGEEILPSWDSPTSFRRVPSSPSLSRLDILSSSLQSSMSTLSCSVSSQSEPSDFHVLKSMSAPSRSEGFLNCMEVQVAGGAAGEDRVQAVCSEENGWLFCAIYDGFSGRDAADFLAGTLYETIVFKLNSLECESKQENVIASDLTSDGSLLYFLEGSNSSPREKTPPRIYDNKVRRVENVTKEASSRKQEVMYASFRQGVLDSLQRALCQAESDFLYMVEQEMEERPDLVSIGSCVLVVLLLGKDLYTLNLGDSRAVLATYGEGINMDETEDLEAVQLTDSHNVDNEVELAQLLYDHPDDPTTFVSGRVKGKLKLTRAFGVGYLKKENPKYHKVECEDSLPMKKLNDALMGILKVRNLLSPPYISSEPSLNVHRISKDDQFVIVASDGLFDFFSNDEAVKLIHSYILSNPSGDPAKFLLGQLVSRAADGAGFSTEELMKIPDGVRRKYHDDVTVIVIILGTNQRTSKASTRL
ncbi:hypothetical protein HHK36_012435 [Tetracentron sinense]|uniref:PPM-type phosphatase domain-containing protein n=1 Tax=Tetracentron sinense TaxID=13715 RepID=A0A834Z6U8_TETSI|nr:hypothetical protein HHK36_012435 [Tetracentron sinense]